MGLKSALSGALRRGAPVVGSGTVAAAQNIASGAGTGARAAASGARWLAAVGLGTFFSNVADPGMIIFIAGLIKFLFQVSLSGAVDIFFSFALMVLCILFLFEGKGMLILLLWGIWSGYFGSPSPYPLSGSFLTFAIIAAVACVVWAVGFGREALTQEAVGFIPIIIFYIDVGLVHYLVDYFGLNLTPFMQNLINFTPWWALLGIFLSKSDKFLIQLVKMLAIIYVIFVLILGAAPGYGWQKGLPGTDTLRDARDKLSSQKLPGENPGYSQIVCISQNLADPSQVDACVKGRQAESRCKYLRKPDIPDGDNEELQACLRQAKGEKIAQQISGGIDPTAKEYTKIEIVKPEGFPDEIPSGLKSIPVEIVAETPRSDLLVRVTCTFKSGQTTIPGTSNVDQRGITLRKGKDRKSLKCSPTSELPAGGTTLKVEVDVENMQTSSRLGRAFVGSTMPEAARKEVLSTHFSQGEGKSRGPPEFMRIDFAAGDPLTDPLIESTDNPLLLATIENIGGGQATAIKRLRIDMPQGVTLADPTCAFVPTQNGIVYEHYPLSSTNKKSRIVLDVCALTLDESILSQIPEDGYIFRDNFIATIEYNYKIMKEFSFRIEKVNIQ